MKSALRELNKNETMRKLFDQNEIHKFDCMKENYVSPFSFYVGCQDKSLKMCAIGDQIYKAFNVQYQCSVKIYWFESRMLIRAKEEKKT